MTNCLTKLACIPISGNVGQCVCVPFLLSTYSLSRSKSTSSPHRRSGKKDKQVKQHENVTSQSDEGLHRPTPVKCSTLYVPLFITN